jgi:glycosyltransferase involved in cell wall biosynthesis
MKVLWLTSSPGGASDFIKSTLPGRGWIASLENHIKNIEDIDLAICFFHNRIHDFKFTHEKVTYYPIKDKLSSIIGKVTSKAFNRLYDSNLPSLLKVVNDFKPDIIQLFGTESGLGEIVTSTDIPIVIHIQGLINPYLAAWFPKGVSQASILMNSSLSEILRKNSAWGLYFLFKKMAEREKYILENAENFFGRTEWDKRIVKMYNAQAHYVHCDEVLRPFFFSHCWQLKHTSTLRLVTTINANIYKGIEIVLATAEILRKQTRLSLQWNIIGISPDSKLVRLIEKISGKRFVDNFVFFKGTMTGSQLVEELLNANIFVHPSHIDNSPNSVCEAMLLGMPVIAGNVGGVSSIIEDKHNGILYNSYDPFELAAIILESAKNTSALKRLGDNARDTALKRHNVATIVSTILETYQSLTLKYA